MMYGTQAEQAEEELIRQRFRGFDLINPKIFEGNPEKKRDVMAFCKRIVDTCQTLVYTKWKGGVTSGVLDEVNHAMDVSIPVFELAGKEFIQRIKHIDGLSYAETTKRYDQDIVERLKARRQNRIRNIE